VWEKHYRNGKLPGQVKKGSFWWRDVLKLLPSYKEMAVIQVKNGHSCFFWKDSWSAQTLEQQFPQIYSFAKNRFIAVKRAFSQELISDMFNLPLSQEAFDKMMSIHR
jgi:hypothetical protein